MKMEITKMGKQRWENEDGKTKMGKQRWQNNDEKMKIGKQRWKIKIGRQTWENKDGKTKTDYDKTFHKQFHWTLQLI